MTSYQEEVPALLSSRKIYHGNQFQVSIDLVREHGRIREREVVHHPGSAAIVAIFEDGTVGLVRQYRHPAVRYLLEIPAGTLNADEAPEEGAARELEEELGVVAGKLEKLSEFFVSPGFLAEKMWVYLATNLRMTQQQLEDDEILEVVRYPVFQALEMITTGEIEDAKTIIGLMLAAPRVGPSMLEVEYPAV